MSPIGIPGADEPLGDRPHGPVPADRDHDVRALAPPPSRVWPTPGSAIGRLEPERLGQPLLRAGRARPPSRSAGTSCLEGLATNATSCPVASTSRASCSVPLGAGDSRPRRLDPPPQLTLPRARGSRATQEGRRATTTSRATTATHASQVMGRIYGARR